MSPPTEEQGCEHDFILYNDIPGEWKLIWECRKCGMLCICKCFKKSIEGMEAAMDVLDFPAGHDVERLAEIKAKSVPEMRSILEDIPYKGMSCEICLDKPSTHTFSCDMSKNEFQRNYGAYIIKEAISMVLDGTECDDSDTMLDMAEDRLRMTYGFRPRDETDVDDMMLFSAVRDAYPGREILHHHRPDWLDEGDLEVFIPSLSVALEYRSREHYELPDDGDTEVLEGIQSADERKAELCRANGIRLIVIPYYREMDRDTVLWASRNGGDLS